MTRRPKTRIESGAWRATARLLIVLFALRALVPLGFMPDLSALRDGRVEIVICTAAGAKTVRVDKERQPVETDRLKKNNAADDNDCPFYKTVAKPFAVPNGPLLGAGPDRAPPSAFIAADSARQPLSLGPPLGSRAPPLRLG